MLLTSRTPLRISFFGGGTDYPEYFLDRPGAVVGMAINKYVYISLLRISDVIDYRYRVSYSKLEKTVTIDEIQHPVVRCVLNDRNIVTPLDINVMSDLPASSGLGSSSAFTVGFVNAINALTRQPMTRIELGKAAIRVERDLLGERVGIQDQLHAAFGGLNRFDFVGGHIRITPIQMTAACQGRLLSSMCLVYTGVTRHASAVLDQQITATKARVIDRELGHLIDLTNSACDLLENGAPGTFVEEFGAMMHEGWQTKRRLSASVSSPEIDALYDACRAAGATGGKLCGAGSGGFLLMIVPPEKRAGFEKGLAGTPIIPVDLDHQGSVILAG